MAASKAEAKEVLATRQALASRPAADARQQAKPTYDGRANFKTNSIVWGFEGEEPKGVQPVAGWIPRETNGAGTPARWSARMVKEPFQGSNVLAVVARGTGQNYNLFISSEVKLADLSLLCGVRANFGQEDQGGGPVWRLQDASNYYVCRINPLEDNFRLYKVVEGERTQLATAEFVCEPDTWYRIAVQAEGDHIRCSVNGEWLLDVHDSTFQEAGRVGFWTKADASTWFDGLMITK